MGEEEPASCATTSVPVMVMLPLDTVNADGVFRYASSKWFLPAIRQLAATGIHGVAVDVWWGAVERSPRRYDWSGYRQLFSAIKPLGLKFQVVMSFHACGGNVGDNALVPLPPWVHKVGDSDPDIFFTDRPRESSPGQRNREYISWFAETEPGLLRGRSVMECYIDFMRAFRDEFMGELGSLIEEVVVGSGPCGELRYPAYPETNGWRFPGIGEFQCYDRRALASLARAAGAAGHPEWGNSGPSNAGSYNSHPEETGFFQTWNGGWQSPQGEFFLGWYSDALLEHGERMLTAVTSVFNSPGGSSSGDPSPRSSDTMVGSPHTSVGVGGTVSPAPSSSPNPRTRGRGPPSQHPGGGPVATWQGDGPPPASPSHSFHLPQPPPANGTPDGMMAAVSFAGMASPGGAGGFNGPFGSASLLPPAARPDQESAAQRLLPPAARPGPDSAAQRLPWNCVGLGAPPAAPALALRRSRTMETLGAAGGADAALAGPGGSAHGLSLWQAGRSGSVASAAELAAVAEAAAAVAAPWGRPGAPAAAAAPRMHHQPSFSSLRSSVSGENLGGEETAAATAAAARPGPRGACVALSLKLAGVHWWYQTPSHAAELTAGYYNTPERDGYAALCALCARHGAAATLTCVEMCDAQHPPEALCGPEGVLRQVREAAAAHGVPLAGENALPCFMPASVDEAALARIVRNSRAWGSPLEESAGRGAGGGRDGAGGPPYQLPPLRGCTFLRLTRELMAPSYQEHWVRFMAQMKVNGGPARTQTQTKL